MHKDHILIVDDEFDLAASCQKLLDSQGYRTGSAGSGEEALQSVAEEEPDLVLTDLKMPGAGGMELLRRLREDHPNVQTVMMTAYSTIEDAVEAMRLGAVDFVPKPFTPDHLSIVVSKALEERSLREENRSLRDQLQREYSFDNIVGKSSAMIKIFRVDQEDRRQRYQRPRQWRERHRQRAHSPQHSRQQQTQGQGVRADQLRRAAGEPRGR